jgi:hypothetical protein
MLEKGEAGWGERERRAPGWAGWARARKREAWAEFVKRIFFSNFILF